MTWHQGCAETMGSLSLFSAQMQVCRQAHLSVIAMLKCQSDTAATLVGNYCTLDPHQSIAIETRGSGGGLV